MKKILPLLLLVMAVAQPSFGFSKRIDFSSTNAPSSFSTGGTSLVITGIPSYAKQMLAFSTASMVVAINCVQGNLNAPPDDTENLYIPASGGGIAVTTYNGGACYIKGDSGSISSGILYLMFVAG